MLFVIIKIFGCDSVKNLIIFLQLKISTLCQKITENYFNIFEEKQRFSQNCSPNTIILQKVTSDDGY